MILLKHNQLIQFILKGFKAVLDIREVFGDGDIRRMNVLAIIEALLTEQLLVGVSTIFFFADEENVFETTGAERSKVFMELSLPLSKGLPALHI
jgi:hypothetical protein